MLYARRFGCVAAAMVVCLAARPSLGQIRYSEYAGGKQIWIPVGQFVARSQLDGVDNFVPDALAATPPLSGAAYYFPLNAGDLGSSPGVFLDCWVQYDVLPSDLPASFVMSGTWYFWTRSQQPAETNSANYNKDSDWLVVNGDTLDLDKSTPTDADWYTAATASVRSRDRITNDVSPSGAREAWAWIGHIVDDTTYRLSKTMKLIDSKFSFRIYEAEASDWNARIDVICWSTVPNYTPTDGVDGWGGALVLGQCARQHEPTLIDQTSHANDSDTTLVITGTDLDLVMVTGTSTSTRLSPVAGGADLIGTNPVLGAGNTTLTVTFPTNGAQWGRYSVVTEQAAPCFSKILIDVFDLYCASRTTFASAQPATISNPTGPVQLRITGTNVTLLTSVSLKYGNDTPVIAGSLLTIDGNDLLATFDFNCVPAGPYHLIGTREQSCSNPADRQNAVWVIKPPPMQACAWLPWAASWSDLNTGTAISGTTVFNPTNWDYSLTQETLLNTPKDTPPGGGNYALHWFLDGQPSGTLTGGLGSGGVYQQIPVTAGTPIQYSYFWKVACNAGDNNWFEFLLIDGPFNIVAADTFGESPSANNPSMIRKRTLTAGGWGWQEVTDQTTADTGPAGNRPTTITPTGNVVTVVLKAGRVPRGALESFWDNVVVQQANGPNLIVNGDFESYPERTTCDATSMAQDACENQFWLWNAYSPLPPCPQRWGDTDIDLDLDMDDFAALQLCYNFGGGTTTEACRCFDRPEPTVPNGAIDEFDMLTFIQCASGPGIPAPTNCGN